MADRLFVATRKGLFTVHRGAAGWKIARCEFFGDNIPMMLPDQRDGALYAALAHGHFGSKIHRSRDDGKTWEEIGVPTYPEPSAGEEPVLCPMRGTPVSNKLELIWSLEAGGTAEPGVLWCGTVPGGLFKSTDSGASWSLVQSLWNHPSRRKWFGGGLDWPGIHSICVHPRDSRHVTIGISCGGVWVTRDSGQTWTCKADGMRAEYMPPEQAGTPDIQDPHRVVQCAANPDALWAQHHNGIFVTMNGCESWCEVKSAMPSGFGFAVAVHPRDGQTAWFVPAVKDERRVPVDARVVVSRTRDGGHTFEVLREGLPQEHAYDIAFRHALDIDDTGERLAFGTTTGSVWITENGGDRWTHLSAHLPPVYCVRFG